MAEKLKLVKGAHLGHLGRALNSLEAALTNVEGVDPIEVTKYLESVDIKYAKVEEDSEKLLEIYTDKAQIETEIEAIDTLQDRVTNIKTRANAALDDIRDQKETARRAAEAASRIVPEPIRGHQQEPASKIRTPKLPDLQIEKYRGELEKYQEFMDSFTATIDNNPKLEEVDKFRYLRMYIEDVKEGDGPKSLIEGFSTTAGNYKAALQLIKETYGKKERIIMSHVSKLLNLEKRENLDKSALRVLFNKVNVHVRQLEVLEITAEQYSIFLVPIVLSKLTHTLRVAWGKYKDKEDITELLEFMQIEIGSLEEARQVESAFAPQEQVTKKKYNSEARSNSEARYPKTSSAAALNTVTKKICIFCPESSDHYVEQCGKATSMSLVERKEILFKENACWCCFKRGHRKAECRLLRSLSCNICKRQHHTLLHEDRIKGNTGCASCSNQVLMPVAKGRLVGPTGKQVEVNIMLDPASDQSFVDEETSRALELSGRTVELSVGGITGHVDETKTRKVVKATVKNRHHLEKFQEVELIELPVIFNNLSRPGVKKEVLESKYIKDIQLADDYTKKNECNINVLLGLNNYYSVVSGKVRRASEKPIAIDTIFGWVLVTDSSNSCTASSNVLCLLTSTKEENQISNQLKKFWEIEEICPENKSKWSVRDTVVFNEFKESIEYKNQRYTVKLPMIEEQDEKKYTNKTLATNRFIRRQKQFRKDPEFEARYTEAVNEYIQSGYAEKVQSEVEPENSNYLPSQLVVKEESTTTKHRFVFDGSAAEDGSKSINEKLEKGPTLPPLLNSILLRFRLHRIAVTSDVRKMYLMIEIAEEDRDKLRFLWQNEETKEIEVYRNCVLPFGLRCSPFLAVGTVQHHLLKYEEEYPELVKEMIESTYIDDMLTGVETEEEAIEMYQNSSRIMREASMEMRKWNTNNASVKEVFRRDGVAAEANKTITDDAENTYKLLGISYNPEGDQFEFNVKDIVEKAQQNQARITKRVILSTSPMLYDPMGWLNPFIVTVKLIIQALWERGVEWDEAVPPDLEKKWKTWVEELSYLQGLKIPRRYNHSESSIDHSLTELHTFGDASESAYAAVSYLKTYDTEGKSEVALMYCKSKVAPIKKVTLPRLELQAAVLAAKMSKFIKEEINLPQIKTYLWTDSTTVLHWIKSTSRQYKTYVANRVQLVQELSEPADWNWCPGQENNADMPSRGVSMIDLVRSNKWWGGPSWLNENVESYPKAENLKQPAEEILEKKTVCMLQKTIKRDTPIEVRLAGKIVDHMKYSKFRTLIRTTAYLIIYIFNIMHKEEERKSASLSAENIVQAENYWLQRIQEEAFPTEVQKLQHKEMVSRDSKLVKLSPYYDEEDGLVKMGGRLQYSDLEEKEKHPIILPYHSYIVKLIIEDIHRRQLHSGINHTLIAVRDRFWVLKGRNLVRRIVKSCLVCRKYLPVRMKVPMAPLPQDRVKHSHPFQVCGVDFTGPIYVSSGNGVQKSYIVLYTCANIRAVHLELVADQTTEAFLRSLRRMISRRGMISTFYSDNSKTFESASNEMQRYMKIMNGKKFKDFLTDHKIEWKFIADYAPWWGGFYERMMKTIKTPLKKILGRSVYSSDEIYTMLTEVEAMVNSRPLTYVSDEASEMKYLTPASFLVGRELINIPVEPVKSTEKSLRKKELKKIMLMQNRTLNLLWKTLREEYKRNLGTVPTKIEDSQCISPGELVMVTEHYIPRAKWRVGLVEKCKAGPDQRVRTVWVRTSSGVICRPVQHISRLELDSLEEFNHLSI